MRGDGIRYAIEHCDEKLAKEIWAELMGPHPDRSAERERKARECEARALKAEAWYKGYVEGAKETIMSLVNKGGLSAEQGAEELEMILRDFSKTFEKRTINNERKKD